MAQASMASDIEWVSRISGTFLKKVHQLGVILAHAYDSLHLIADERLYFGIIVSFVLAAEDQHGGSVMLSRAYQVELTLR